jgi:hypothetical protein
MNGCARLATIVLVAIRGRGFSGQAGGNRTTPNAERTGQAKADAAPGEPAQPTVILPWVEVNALASRTMNHTVEGLLIRRKVADTAIVSAGPGSAALYAGLRYRVP